MPVKHTIRANGYGKEETVTMGPAKAIRYHCRECYGMEPGWENEVKDCPSTLCPLHPFRFGRDPSRKVSDKQRAAGRARAAVLNRSILAKE